MEGSLGEMRIPRDGFLEKTLLEGGVVEARGLMVEEKHAGMVQFVLRTWWVSRTGVDQSPMHSLSKQPWELEQCRL